MKRVLTCHQILLVGALLSSSFVSISQAQPNKPTTTKKARNPRNTPAVKRLEAIAGRRLTDAELKSVQAAVKERTAAMKPITARFNASVAKTLGLSVTEFEKRLKASRAAQRAKARASR